MNKLLASLALCALSAVAATSAMAASLVNTTGVAANAVQDFSDTGLIAFNLDVGQLLSPVKLDYVLSAGDVAGTLSFNAVVANLTGHPMKALSFKLEGANFGTIGTVTRHFGGTTAASGLNTPQATLVFTGPEFFDVFVGNPLGTPGASDWGIATGGLQAGSTLSLTVTAVPEPQGPALILAGLSVLGLLATRRQQR